MTQPLGFHCEVPNEWGMHLYHIASSILSIPSTWIRSDFEEILCLDNENEDLFHHHPNMLDHATLKEILCSKKHYTIFSTLFGYFNKINKHSPITNIQDFIASDVDVIICIYDSAYVMAFAKDPIILQQLEENCRTLTVTDFEYLYEDAAVIID